MTYRLQKLASGSYDILFNGVIIAGLVRSGEHAYQTKWTVELPVDLPPGERPAPFMEQEHQFPTMQEACAWLGVPEPGP